MKSGRVRAVPVLLFLDGFRSVDSVSHRLESAFPILPGPATLHGGYYDVFRRADLLTELDALEPHSDVVLDLRSTEHLDCSCLGLLVSKLRAWRVTKPGTGLRLINVSPNIRRVLRLVELDRVFIVDELPDDAASRRFNRSATGGV